ncbi:MAG: glycosyltransferase family 4 protein [Candidatus Magasanikbacteria bacterium]|nr:glycosyltransferase family 4 protein [Candidatus Magasanikbacteria bacterium]
MKVAFFSPSADRKNGWGEVAYELCAAYERAFDSGLDFDLYLPKSEAKKDYLKSIPFADKVHCVLPDFAFSFRNPIRLLAYLLPIRLVKKPDIIHALDFPYAVSAWRGSKKKIPYIITLCGTFYKPLNRLPDSVIFQSVYNNAAHVSAISSFTLNGSKKLFHLSPEKTSVIHAGVNYDRFIKSCDTKSVLSQYPDDAKIILGIGALKARKGFDIVIRAMSQVCKIVPSAIYVIVGKGSDEFFLRSLVNELGLSNSIFFATSVDDEKLPAYVQSAHVYCHTPRMVDGAFEGFGIVYLQAGVAGKPVVGSNSGGVADAVLDNKTGILVPENDPDATAQALISLLVDKELSNRLGKAGKEYAQSHDWNKIAQLYIEEYKKIFN